MIVATIGGPEPIELGGKIVNRLEFSVDTPSDSSARSTDQYTQLIMGGQINPSVGSADTEPTVAIDRWAAVPDDRIDAYRPVEATVIESGVVLRRYKLPNAFVVDYKVEYKDVEGIGVFTLILRQKKDETKKVTVEGGFAS
jgi:hypothetical protein